MLFSADRRPDAPPRSGPSAAVSQHRQGYQSGERCSNIRVKQKIMDPVFCDFGLFVFFVHDAVI